ncbi:hypothetical protein PIROE2DRAFT_19142 [Piromyces sp. E2]|nr:hypothetical protein PIROE2DRAFT_19142 [Piromyces sp. E2]|eukprot:OUM56308.1 hypothetical protein PIROE2DRAFT_19142 [Piromyces sp. E2]
MSFPYIILIQELTNIINKSQYFNPFFSWVIVVYTYFSIGIHGAIRMVISYLDVTGKQAVIKNNLKTGKNDIYDDTISNYFNSALYLPLGIVCSVFIFLIIQKFITEDNKEKSDILSVFLHSTLSRMLFGKYYY